MEKPVEPVHHRASGADGLAAHEHGASEPGPASPVRARLAAAISELSDAAAELDAA
jgi:hypothetical protein